jgi:Spy/CpxP family protein refolding chaperone
MKKKIWFYFPLALILFFTIESQGQRGMRGNADGDCRIPDLTEEQSLKIEELRTQQLAATNQHRARMNELRARKRSLSIAENPDMNAINKVIDEMESLRSGHFKAVAAHRQAVRGILTAEQRTYFDSRPRMAPGEGKMQRGDGRRGDRRSDHGQQGRGRY